MATKDQREYQEYLDLCERIKATTEPIKNETEKQKQKRIKKLLADFPKFCNYYFSDFIDAEFGWFHLKADKAIDKKNCMVALEWAREHAKSVFSCVFKPMHLKAKGELTGMVVASANADKAAVLLGDIQAQLSSNQRFIADFGEQISLGDWRTGHFSTRDGAGFWSFGRGQSPRGIRKASKRPNYAVVDDIDDKKLVKNPERVKEVVDWIFEELYPAMPIKETRLVFAGNRIHKHSVLAHVVGDTEVGKPKRKGLVHIKVFAIENRLHKESFFGQRGAKPAWKERYTITQLKNKLEKMPYHSMMREYFHRHVEQGLVFKPEWIHYIKTLAKAKYKHIVSYCDPSFKDTKNADTKAIVTLGIHYDGKIDVLDIWVRRTSISNMVKAFYDLHDKYESFSDYWIEANMLQDLFLEEFDDEAKNRGYNLPIRGDKRKKPDKVTRIMNLEPLFQRAKLRFCEKLKGSPDMEQFLIQLLGFPTAANDDGPDALEGGIIKLNKAAKTSNSKPRMGKYTRSKRSNR
jgi:predicted phage terminase large subunit-like protein